MSSTSTVRMWAPTSKYCCLGFHILNMYSSSLTWDFILETWENFRSLHPRNEAIDAAFSLALASSSSCFLSFHTTILTEMTCLKPNLKHLDTLSTFKNTSKSLFLLGNPSFWRDLWHRLSLLETKWCHRLCRCKKCYFPRAPLFPQRRSTLPRKWILSLGKNPPKLIKILGKIKLQPWKWWEWSWLLLETDGSGNEHVMAPETPTEIYTQKLQMALQNLVNGKWDVFTISFDFYRILFRVFILF